MNRTRAILPLGATVLLTLAAPVRGVAAEAPPSAPTRTAHEVLGERAKAAERAPTPSLAGLDGWLFLAGDIRQLAMATTAAAEPAPAQAAPAHPAPAAAAPDSDPLAAIVDFHAQLTSVGVDLIVAIVPAKSEIYPERLDAALAPPTARLDTTSAALLAALGEAGVRTIDLFPKLLEERQKAPDPALYLRTDSHPSPRGIDLIARAIAEAIATPPWLAEVVKLVPPLASERHQVTIEGDLWRMMPALARPAKEEVEIEVVGTKANPKLPAVTPIPPDRASPVLLLGDSQNLIFHGGGDMHARGAGLPDHLAKALGFAVDVVAVRGSGATPARVNLMRRGDGLKGKRIVIWCFSARELSAGPVWKKIRVLGL